MNIKNGPVALGGNDSVQNELQELPPKNGCVRHGDIL